MLKTKIPFPGFYGSLFDVAIDGVIERTLEDENLEYDQIQVDYPALHTELAGMYFNRFIEELSDATKADFSNSKFIGLWSPREYNFHNDEIDAEIPTPALRAAIATVPRDTIAAHVREKLSPRSGFIPFYPADFNDWPDIDEMDTPQLLVILEAIAEHHGIDPMDIEESVVEYLSGNGLVDEHIDWSKIDQAA